MPQIRPRAITLSLVGPLLVFREKDSNKGTYGHVMVVAGSRAMSGAARLCSAAALRSGAGLVTAAVPGSVRQLVAAASTPEIMTLGLPESKEGTLSPRALPVLASYAAESKITAAAVGPGLGSSAHINSFIEGLVNKISVPLVIDADALNALATFYSQGCIPLLQTAKKGSIVTPHPGEMSRLTGLSVANVQKEREKTAACFASTNHTVCVLKGYKTVVSDGSSVYINTTGNPGMATGGSGDVLTGIIAALIPQVKEPRLLNAALCGVYVHGLAGDIAAMAMTEISLIAGDIIAALPQAFARINGRRHLCAT